MMQERARRLSHIWGHRGQTAEAGPFNAYGSSAQDSEYPADVVSAKRFTAWLVEAEPHIIRPIRALQ